MLSLLMRLVGCLLFFCSAVLAIPTISVKGSKFFTSDGDQFYIKGVAYTASANNANNIVNGSQCELDAPRIKELGANTIRVYSVDPTLDHDKCMDAFANAGIYVLVDMATPVFFINRITPEWTKELRNAFAQVIDGFQKYDNLLGFFAGNEIINDPKSTGAAAYAKAVIADMKAYRDLMQYRKIPIGYSAADLDDLRLQQQDYFNCGSDDISADFFGTNRYSWCGASSFTKSGYDTMYSQVDGYSIPYFLSETGCLGSGDFRIFDDQIALLGRQMNDRLSGNIIYQWGEQPNGYGLVSYANTESGTGAVKTKQDFSNLKSQWATLEPAGVKASDYDPTLTRRDCPEFTSGVWNIRANDQLPTLGVDGFTAPTRPRSTPRTEQTQTASGTTPAGVATSGAKEKPQDTSNTQSSKGVSTKVIVGIVLGVLIGIALILGAILFFLRRVRNQRATKEQGPGERKGDESDKMVVGPEEAKNNSPHDFYGPRYPELSGNGAAQELDPARGNIATMRANEMASGESGQMVELYDGQGALQPGERGLAPLPVPLPARVPPTAPEPSPYVQAQRKVEMSWLESEEARLRQRREQLMKQGGGT